MNSTEHFIKDLIEKNNDLFTEHDFTDCQKAVKDFAGLVENLEQTQFKFRRKLTDVAEKVPQDKERVIYLQGMVDGMNLMIGPLKTFVNQ